MTPEQAARRRQQEQVARQRRDVELETFPVTGGSKAKTSHPMFGTSGAGTAARPRLRGLVTEPPAPAGLDVWGTWAPAPIEHVGGGYHLLACNLISQDDGWYGQIEGFGSDDFYKRWAVAVWLIRPDGTFSDAWVSPGNLVRPYTFNGVTLGALNAPPYGEPTEGSTPKLARWRQGALLSFTSFTNERQHFDDFSDFWPQADTEELELPQGANVYYHVGHDGTDPVIGPPFELYHGPDADFPTSGDWDVGGGVTEFDDGTTEGAEVVGPSADANIAVYGLAQNSKRHRIWLLDKDAGQNLTLTARTNWPDTIPVANPGGLTRIGADRWVAMCSRKVFDVEDRGMSAILFNAKTGTVVDTATWDDGGDYVDCYHLNSFFAYYAGNHLHFDGQAMFAAWWETDFTDLQHRFTRITVTGDTLNVGPVTVWEDEPGATGFSERLIETCEGCLRIVTTWDSRRQALFERYKAKAPMSPLPSPEYLPSNEVLEDQRTVPTSHPAGFMWACNVALGDTWDGFTPIVPKLIRYPDGNTAGRTGVATPLSAPATPENVTATAGDGQVLVTWTAATLPAPDGYRIFRSETDDFGTATQISGDLDPSTSSYLDETAASGTTYFYWVVAYNDEGSSDPAPTGPATPTAALSLSDLSDVDTAGADDGDLLTFNAGTSTWQPGAPT